jgi:two-component system, OmpR family, sensor histidine kinase MprB
MSFRRRLALSCAGAVAVAVVLGSILAYFIVRGTLRGQIDSALRTQQVRVDAPAGGPSVAMGDVMFLTDTPAYTRFVMKGAPPPNPGLEAGSLGDTQEIEDVATGHRDPFFADRTVNGVHVRVYTGMAGPGMAIQTARPLTEVDDALAKLRIALALLTLAGIGLALFLSRLAMRTAAKPVAELTATAEHVANTRDLSQRIDAQGDDELSRLARAFNTMLEALQRSQLAQRQLVADASHELRTPLTSLRTNMEVMARGGPPDEADRTRLRNDVVVQLEELTELVGDLVELAREEEPAPAHAEVVNFGELVQDAVARAQRHSPLIRFEPELEPSLVYGVAARLDRAVANLLDNAAKWSPPGGTIRVRLHGGELSVCDEGPGIDPADLPHIFDRFYRGADARSRPGSGLGLAIVRQVAAQLGGAISAEPAPGAGTLMRLRLPGLETVGEEAEADSAAARKPAGVRP